MTGRYEYKVIPAPTKGARAKGAKGAEARFSHALTVLMNDMAGDGWEFQRAESLPSLERVGLTKTEKQHHNLLVFRRPHPEHVQNTVPQVAAAPEAVSDDAPSPAPRFSVSTTPEPSNAPKLTATRDGADDAELPGILKDRGAHLRDTE